jgi:hypothetical protein
MFAPKIEVLKDLKYIEKTGMSKSDLRNENILIGSSKDITRRHLVEKLSTPTNTQSPLYLQISD